MGEFIKIILKDDFANSIGTFFNTELGTQLTIEVCKNIYLGISLLITQYHPAS